MCLKYDHAGDEEFVERVEAVQPRVLGFEGRSLFRQAHGLTEAVVLHDGLPLFAHGRELHVTL